MNVVILINQYIALLLLNVKILYAPNNIKVISIFIVLKNINYKNIV